MRQPEEDDVRPLVARFAEACLAALQGNKPRPEPVVRTKGGWTVLLSAFPTPAGEQPPDLTDCDRDCLSFLVQTGKPFSAVRVRRELEKRRIGIWAIATVKRSLARLKKMGLVANSRRRPRGYYVEEASGLAWLFAQQ